MPKVVEADMRAYIKARVLVDSNGCWLWLLARKPSGYGLIGRVKGRTARLAHKASYLAFVGDYDQSLQLDHTCKVPECVNPEHLEPVSQTENVHRSKATKLSAKDITSIRQSSLGQYQLAELFNVGQSHISRIKNNEVWRTA